MRGYSLWPHSWGMVLRLLWGCSTDDTFTRYHWDQRNQLRGQLGVPLELWVESGSFLTCAGLKWWTAMEAEAHGSHVSHMDACRQLWRPRHYGTGTIYYWQWQWKCRSLIICYPVIQHYSFHWREYEGGCFGGRTGNIERKYEKGEHSGEFSLQDRMSERASHWKYSATQ